MTKVVEICNTTARTISGTSAKTGKDYSFRVQQAYLHSGGGYPKEFEITLDDQAQPYAQGFYDLSHESVYINRQGRLAVNPMLVPGAVKPK